MPWTQTDPVLERQKFVKALMTKRLTMTEACLQFGISRKTRLQGDGEARRAGNGRTR
jgi:hypothetical protein